MHTLQILNRMQQYFTPKVLHFLKAGVHNSKGEVQVHSTHEALSVGGKEGISLHVIIHFLTGNRGLEDVRVAFSWQLLVMFVGKG